MSSLRALIQQFAASPARGARALAVRCGLCKAGVGERCHKVRRAAGGGYLVLPAHTVRPHQARLDKEERRGFESRCPGCGALAVTGEHRPSCRYLARARAARAA